MKWIALMVVALLAPGCIMLTPDPNLVETLRDCTVEFQGPLPEGPHKIGPEDLRDILNAATQWAIRWNQFPCDLTMCAAITKAGPKKVSVWIRGYGDIYPSSEITLFRHSYIVVDWRAHGNECPGGKYEFN